MPDSDLLKHLASRYMWWKTPDEAIKNPDRLIAQVMDIGDYDDMSVLANQVGDQTLRRVLTHAEAGQFSPKSWHYWHYRLGLVSFPEPMPDMPKRQVE